VALRLTLWRAASVARTPTRLTLRAGAVYPWRVIRAFTLAVVLGLASACVGMMPPTYTQAELAQQCQRTGGWWHPDDLMGGNCEYETGGFQ
jgi:hypothetical protein